MAGYRKFSIEEKIKLCKLAIANKEKGISINKTSKSMDASDVSLRKWVKQFESGEIGFIPETHGKSDISTGLMSELSKNFNGISGANQVEYIVFTGELKDKRLFPVLIEEPEISDPDEKELEVMRRILEKLQWFPSVKGFKFPEGGKEK